MGCCVHVGFFFLRSVEQQSKGSSDDVPHRSGA
jgi:hypothetical protein